MERSSSQKYPHSPSPPPACGAASPSSGGEFLLQLLQQGRFPSSGSRIDHSSYGDGDAICSRHHSSSTSSGTDRGRASSLEASVSSSVFEEDISKTHPLCRASSQEPPFLDEEQVRFQLHHDPAVAAMGPSHPVGGVSAIANNLGNMNGDRRGVFPSRDRFANPYHQHHQPHYHQHLCLQQVAPSPPFDFPLPERSLSEHMRPFPLDPLLPPVHNQFQRPYPYPHVPPMMDHSVYLHVRPSIPHTGLLNSNRLQDTSSTLSYASLDHLKPFANDGLTNGQSIASMRILVPAHRSTTDMGSLSSSEPGMAPPNPQFYTQFGSIGAEIPHQTGSESKLSHPCLPKTTIFQQLSSSSVNEHEGGLPLKEVVMGRGVAFVDSLKGDRVNHSLDVETNNIVTATSEVHAFQRRALERFDTQCPPSMEKLEMHAVPMNRVPVVDISGLQIERPANTTMGATTSATNVSNADSGHDSNLEVKARPSKPQKGMGSMRKGGSKIGLGHWVPVTKDTREEATVDKTDSAVEGLPSKITDDAERQRVLNQGWQSKQLNLTSDVPIEKPADASKRFDRFMRTKLPLQQDPLGLPSGSKVDSAPSSATEQSKQALQTTLDSDEVELWRMQEGSVNYVKPAVDSRDGAKDPSVEALVGGLSLSELDIVREEKDEPASKNKASISEVPLDFKEHDMRTTPPTKFSRREPFHRIDSGKCTYMFLAIFQTLIPPIDEEQRRKQLFSTLDELVSGIWPEARLYLFGSCANAFGVCNSDIDVCLSIEGENTPRSEVVCMLADALKANNMQNVQALTHARVPIVKYSDPKTGISCDVCVNNMLAVVNTKLLHDYAQIDTRLRQLAFIVKHWAKRRQVNETYRGTLSSYAYVLMCIHFLQQRKPAVLPCLQEMEPTYMVTVGDIKCAYFDKVDKLKGFGQKNKETLADLVTSFFDYWAFRHDYTRTVISIRTGKFLSKVEKDWTRRIGNERHLICIEDPFEVSHDLGRVVDKHSIRVLRDEFQRAARIMRQDANPCAALFEPYIRQKAQAA